MKKSYGGTTTTYIFSGTKPIAEYVGGTVTREYIYSGQTQLAEIAYSGLNVSVTYKYPDHLSTRDETDASGNLTRTFGHLPFGENWYETGTTSKWKFTTYERDSESYNDYATFRYYENRLGRMMSADPLSASAHAGAPQTWNRYTYALNDPIARLDPSGLDCIYFDDDGTIANYLRGDCASEDDDGYYVEGTIDWSSAFYDEQANALYFEFTDYSTGLATDRVLDDYLEPTLDMLFYATTYEGCMQAAGKEFLAVDSESHLSENVWELGKMTVLEWIGHVIDKPLGPIVFFGYDLPTQVPQMVQSFKANRNAHLKYTQKIPNCEMLPHASW